MVIQPGRETLSLPPAVLRLASLVPLTEPDIAALLGAINAAVVIRARKELVVAGAPVNGPRLIVRGWAARVRGLADGRRQFLGFVLPGELIGLGRQPRPLASTTVVALTEVAVCEPPPEQGSTALRDAYATSHALDEAYLLDQIVRLGRLSGNEKIADLMLELNERLELSGLAAGGRFALPLTQEVLGDALGLTSVHINRVTQQLRRDGELVWSGGEMILNDPAAIARRVGRRRIAVSR